MPKRPLILITACTQAQGAEFGDRSLSLSARYPQAIAAAGGLPLVLPNVLEPDLAADWVQRCHGVVLTGGDDIEPTLYLERVPAALAQTVKGVDRQRDEAEQRLIRQVLQRRKPLLAICRGHQFLNIALGGTLLVDIPSQVRGALPHAQLRRKDEVVHEVTLTPDSLLARVVQSDKLGVNSTHHQAVDRLARELRATAASADGVIEAVEVAPDAARRLPFLLSVQFHPERLYERHPEHFRLLRAFTRACAAQHN
jgi:putative glutamine amidotransferase